MLLMLDIGVLILLTKHMFIHCLKIFQNKNCGSFMK